MQMFIKLLASTSCAILFTTGLFAADHLRHSNTQISFTELNTDWFGINGDPKNDLGNEPRVQTLRKFLHDNDLLADVMVLEEVVDLDLLASSVLDNQYDCHTDVRKNPKYQHVVICVQLAYHFDMAEDGDNYTLEDVDVTGKLRPAIHGILKASDGTRLVHIMGVHLKANADKSEVRLKQTQVITDYLERQTNQDPVIILGDFNTFGNDVRDMGNQFKTVGLVELNLPENYTWSSVKENFPPAKLDRVWISQTLVTKVQSAHVVGPCNSSDRTQLATYNENVSDHCPTKFIISQ